MEITLFDLAQRYVGIRELKQGDHPLIQWWLSLCGFALETPDEIPWCSAFVNGMAWELRAPRSKSAAARSWLGVGQVKHVGGLIIGWDIVILKRGTGIQPGPEVLDAPGHVGIFAGSSAGKVHLLGGNQSDSVSVEEFPETQVLGYRSLELS